MLKDMANFMFTQMSAKKGLEMFEERAWAALIKEYTQLRDMEVIGRLDPMTLTKQQKRDALRVVNLIKEKRCGKIKGRTCADGRPQRKYVPREESSSPTVSNEALMGVLSIFAKENRAVGVFDVPGAYLHAHMPDDEFVVLRFEGIFVDILCEVMPELLADVVYENGKKVLYVRALKAIYGCIKSALLWYNLYESTLAKDGFEINPYDKCVANKMVNGKQCLSLIHI